MSYGGGGDMSGGYQPRGGWGGPGGRGGGGMQPRGGYQAPHHHHQQHQHQYHAQYDQSQQQYVQHHHHHHAGGYRGRGGGGIGYPRGGGHVQQQHQHGGYGAQQQEMNENEHDEDMVDPDYDDSEDEPEEDIDQEAEAFFSQVAKKAPAPTTNIGKQIKTEFDILRVAKTGSKEEFVEALQNGPSDFKISTFTDNKNRTALHYAADAGNEELIQFLIADHGMNPIAADDNGMTPLDVAVINGNSTAALTVSSPYEQIAERATLLKKFAPVPPRFSLSKSVGWSKPTAAMEGGFWGSKQDELNLVEGDSTFVASPSGDVPVDRASFAELFDLNKVTINKFCTAASKGYIGRLKRAQTTFVGIKDKDDSLVAGAALTECKKTRIGNMTHENAVFCRNYAIAEGRQGDKSTARSLASLCRNTIQNDVGAKICLFTSQKCLPIEPICAMKVYRRAINPKKLFKSGANDVIDNVFPEFFKYETILRADETLKGTLGEVPGFSKSWEMCAVSDDLDTVEAIRVFCEAQFALQGAAVFHVPSTAAELQVLLAGDCSVHVNWSADHKVTDLVVLRAKGSRSMEDEDYPHFSGVFLSFAMFTTVSNEQRLMHVAKLAESQDAEAVYVPAANGMTDKDFRLSFFEEVTTYTMFLYAAESSSTSVGAKTPSSKVFLQTLAL